MGLEGCVRGLGRGALAWSGHMTQGDVGQRPPELLRELAQMFSFSRVAEMCKDLQYFQFLQGEIFAHIPSVPHFLELSILYVRSGPEVKIVDIETVVCTFPFC